MNTVGNFCRFLTHRQICTSTVAFNVSLRACSCASPLIWAAGWQIARAASISTEGCQASQGAVIGPTCLAWQSASLCLAVCPGTPLQH